MLSLSGILNTVPATGGGSTPAYGAAGTGQGGGGALTVPWPSHSTNDYGVLFVEQRGNDTTPSTPSGWTLIGTPATGSGSTDTKVTVFVRQATSGAESDVSLADNGNHQNAQIQTVTGASSVAQLGSDSTGSGTAVTLTSGTTGGANRLIMGVVANNTDLDTDQISAWTNGNLASLTDRGGQQSSAVAGGGFDVFTGEKATAGAVGSTTATLATSAAWAGLVLEFAP